MILLNEIKSFKSIRIIYSRKDIKKFIFLYKENKLPNKILLKGRKG